MELFFPAIGTAIVCVAAFLVLRSMNGKHQSLDGIILGWVLFLLLVIVWFPHLFVVIS